jgi:hypothetical protein
MRSQLNIRPAQLPEPEGIYQVPSPNRSYVRGNDAMDQVIVGDAARSHGHRSQVLERNPSDTELETQLGPLARRTFHNAANGMRELRSAITEIKNRADAHWDLDPIRFPPSGLGLVLSLLNRAAIASGVKLLDLKDSADLGRSRIDVKVEGSEEQVSTFAKTMERCLPDNWGTPMPPALGKRGSYDPRTGLEVRADQSNVRAIEIYDPIKNRIVASSSQENTRYSKFDTDKPWPADTQVHFIPKSTLDDVFSRYQSVTEPRLVMILRGAERADDVAFSLRVPKNDRQSSLGELALGAAAVPVP